MGTYVRNSLQIGRGSASIESSPSSASAAVRPMTTTIDDLPNEALCHVGSYLAKPSRALLGVAMVAPSVSWARRGDSAGPVGWLCQYGEREWEVLDFGTIVRLAWRLTDDDLAAVLIGIAGQSSVKRLVLTGCWEMTGRGLDPVRSSSVIEQLDMSCGVSSSGSLSEDSVVPILHDIINAESCSLRQLQLPKKWCGYRYDDYYSLVCVAI